MLHYVKPALPGSRQAEAVGPRCKGLSRIIYNYQTATNAIIVTARRRRDNCGSGLPGAWFCASETRHYSAARSLRSSKLKTVCLWRLRHKQNARFQLVWDDFRRGPGRAGESKLPSSATLADPGSGIAAAQPAGGNQGSDWLPIFLPASGSGCGLLSSWLRVTANFRSARGPNVRTAGAMTINDIAQAWHRQAGHCTHLRKPEGLSEAKLKAKR